MTSSLGGWLGHDVCLLNRVILGLGYCLVEIFEYLFVKLDYFRQVTIDGRA